MKMFAIFYLAQPLSQLIGSPLSGALINIGEGIPGLQGWQAMFFVEGLLAILAGIASLFLLINGPSKAKFLHQDGKDALTTAMAQEDVLRTGSGPSGVLAAMRNGKVWYFTIIYYCLQIAVYGVTFYLPQQVAQLTRQKVGVAVGLLAAVPWLFGMFACLTGTAAAAGIGLINSWGNLGGFVAPILRTSTNESFSSGSAAMGIYALGVLPFLAALMMWGTSRYRNKADELLDN